AVLVTSLYAAHRSDPAVGCLIPGPRTTNIASAMRQSMSDSVPMLVISSVNSVAEMGSGEGYLHEMPDQRATMEQLCAFSKTIWRAQDLPKALAQAFNVFAGARPQPVHIQIPVD